MELVPLGDAAYILRGFPGAGYQMRSALDGLCLPGVVALNAAYDTVGVYVEPEEFNEEAFLRAAGTVHLQSSAGKTHRIGVCYELGEDLAEAASLCGLTVPELIALHANRPYDCFAIGFCPGFPYLGPLPEPLDQLPRRSVPRDRVPPGSVAIAAGQTGIYPLERPGGWHLIGRTPFTIVDEDAEYFPIVAGDCVVFEPISEQNFRELEGKRLDENN